MTPERKLYAEPAVYGTGWTAYIDGEDDLGPDNITGWGRTEAEAIADLEKKLEDES